MLIEFFILMSPNNFQTPSNDKPEDPYETLALLTDEITAKLENYNELIKKDLLNQESKISEQREAINEIFHLFQGKWTIDIIIILYTLQYPSFNEIKHKLKGINAHTLTKRLSLFEEKGIIHRQIIQERPLRVKYFLSQYGQKIITLLLPLIIYLTCHD